MDIESITGAVSGVVYKKDATGYAVLRLQTDGGEAVLVGCIPNPAPGEGITARGRWVTHPNFGRQFEVLDGGCERSLPAGRAAMTAYLTSGAIPGVGMATAKALIDKFGDETLGVIERQPERLTAIKGISPKRAASIGRAYAEREGVKRIIELLDTHRLSPHYALTLYKLYGPGAMQALLGDPYLLARPPFDARFQEVDAMAQARGMDAGDPMRLRAAILYELAYNLDQGHCYIPYHKLITASAQLLRLPDELFGEAFDGLEAGGGVIRERVGGADACYLTALYHAECGVAERVISLSSDFFGQSPDVTRLMEQAERGLSITLADGQRSAVAKAAGSRLFVLTGGPGTGKTTTVRAIVELFGLLGYSTALAAPTGRAAKRLGEVCARDAQTVHRLLGVTPDPDTGELRFSHNEEQPLPFDAVIVDEASMLDVPLTDAILSSLAPGARLILVGDRDQLPSVGPGNVLADLLDCGRVDSVSLRGIFRQAAESRIVTGAHAVNSGVFPDMDNKGDMFWLTRAAPEQAVETIVDLCVRRLPEGMGIPPENIQVLTPTRRGAAGTHSLNAALQQSVNAPGPEKREHRHGGVVFREGDRVIQVRNNYDVPWRTEAETGFGVFNGDIGYILSVDARAERLTVRFDDGRVSDYAFERLGELELAYALTVHKSQGSEYPAVVLALMPCARGLTTRSVLYTAMTRARALLVMVGDKRVMDVMVNAGGRAARYSGLRARLG
ncbi:MAG: ATP-dependent RecD-like DNA helicase [Oscillospiraceae bacterium]|nr:ATP-dependent RecD-like DNA helicase [Oscillospiraceae bacterium]